jgi:acetyl-CoA carboxylase biotin carboxylase subunit
MIAKVICHGLTREEAVARMLRALEECVVDGDKNTIDFQKAILQEPAFQRGDLSTRFLEGYQWDGQTLTLPAPAGSRS